MLPWKGLSALRWLEHERKMEGGCEGEERRVGGSKGAVMPEVAVGLGAVF